MAWTAVSIHGARLSTDCISGALVFPHPEYGLREILVLGDRPLRLSVLEFRLAGGPRTSDGHAGETLHVADAFVRERELTVRYASLAKRGVLPRLWWSFWEYADYLALELRVYMQSPRLESEPASAISAHIGEPVEMLAGGVAMIRPKDSNISLAAVTLEPPDRLSMDLLPSGEQRWQCKLFPDSLEKGVIEVGRAWVVLLPRKNDEQKLADFRSVLERLPWPLTT
jgi:hypothetical protein